MVGSTSDDADREPLVRFRILNLRVQLSAYSGKYGCVLDCDVYTRSDGAGMLASKGIWTVDLRRSNVHVAVKSTVQKYDIEIQSGTVTPKWCHTLEWAGE